MLKIRLRRMGSRHRPFYRVVVSDSRRAPTASALEEVGYYNPRQESSAIAIDADRIAYWQSRGAQVSDAVAKLLKQSSRSAGAEAPETEAEAAPAAEEAAAPEAVPDAEEAAAPESPPADEEAPAAEAEATAEDAEAAAAETKEAASA